jgi:hypothetical protein
MIRGAIENHIMIMTWTIRKTAIIGGLIIIIILAATAAATTIPLQLLLLANAQILDPQNPIVPYVPEEQIQAPTAEDVAALQQAALQENRTTIGPAIYQNVGGFDEDDFDTGFRILVPQYWILDSWTSFDKLVTDETFGDLEARAQGLYDAKGTQLAREGKYEKAVMCIQNQSEPGIGGSVNCPIEKITGSVIISKYEDLETVPLFQPVIQAGRNITADDLIAYHLQLKQQRGSSFGSSYQIRNTTDVAVNLTDAAAATNQAISTLPARFLEYTYYINRYQEQQGIPASITAMLFVVYNDPQTGEVTGYDVEFRTQEFNAANLPAPGMIAQAEHNNLAPELEKIFGSFEIVKTSAASSSAIAEAQGEVTETTQIEETEETEQEEETGCDPSYPDVCIPPPPPNLSCGDDGVPENFEVLPPDPHGFDSNDNDGIGCEDESDQPDEPEEQPPEEEEPEGGEGEGNGGEDGNGGAGEP